MLNRRALLQSIIAGPSFALLPVHAPPTPFLLGQSPLTASRMVTLGTVRAGEVLSFDLGTTGAMRIMNEGGRELLTVAAGEKRTVKFRGTRVSKDGPIEWRIQSANDEVFPRDKAKSASSP